MTAFQTELQARNERTLEGQRGLSEQIIEQRADVKADSDHAGAAGGPDGRRAGFTSRKTLNSMKRDTHPTNHAVARHAISALALSDCIR